MSEELEGLIASEILRRHRPDRPLPEDAAVAGVAGHNVSGLEARITTRLGFVRRGAVLNPGALALQGLSTWLYLATGRTGQFEHVIEASAESRDGVSHHVLYGEWDSLIVLQGNEAEANSFQDMLSLGAFDPPTRLRAEHILLTQGLLPAPLEPASPLPATDVEALAGLISDFDNSSLLDARERLASSRHILGAYWRVDAAHDARVTAFVGIHLSGGRSAIEAPEVLRTLLADEIVAAAMRDLYQLTPATPFHYFLRLSCVSLAELDRVTDQLSLTRISGVGMKCTTLIASSSREEGMTLRQPEIDDLVVGLVSGDLLRTAESVFERLPVDDRRRFNEMAGDVQARLAGYYSELQRSLEEEPLEPATRSTFEVAVVDFTKAMLRSPYEPILTGPIASMSAHVEELARKLLSSVAEAVFPREPGRVQQELRLSNKRIQSLSLGNVVAALETATRHPEFVAFHEVLSDTWMSRLRSFAESRNLWVHGAQLVPKRRLADEAYRTLLESASIAAWLAQTTGAVARPTRSETGGGSLASESGGGPDFFVCHASEDKDAIARPLFRALRERGFSVWLDETELTVGDSLRATIDEAISACRFGIVILSDLFFKKNWPQEELNALFARQMHGTKTILPVWHEIDEATVAQYSPLLADKLAATTATGVESVANKIVAAFEAEAVRGRRPGTAT